MTATALADRLEALRVRVDRVAVEPDAIDAPITRLARPFLRLFGAFADVAPSIVAMSALLDAIPTETDDLPAMRRALRGPLERALLELEDDLRRAEQAQVVHGVLPAGHATWLARRLRALARVGKAVEGSAAAAHLVRGVRPIDVAPPLALKQEAVAGSATPSPPDEPASSAAARLIALQIAAIDHVAEAARAETAVLARRRRLFEAARRLLLDAAASLPLESAGVEVRARAIAEEIVAIDRIEAAGVDPRVGMVHQARAALADGDRQRLHAALVALEATSVRAGDGAAASAVLRALRTTWRKGGRHGEKQVRRSEELSAEDAFGGDVVRAVKDAARIARNAARAVVDGDHTHGDTELAQLVLDYLTPGAAGDTVRAMLAADGWFDVGGTLSPVRVMEAETTARLVRHPTPEMALVRATEPLDVLGAVIEDPRLVWLSLATGRLLTRRFIAHETRQRPRTLQRGEVRVYVVDGSTSMMVNGGARARMRDALLLCELSTLLQRLQSPGARARVTFYYRFFTRELGELRRVATAEEAIGAVGDVVGTARSGGTDIQGALLESLRIVQAARDEASGTRGELGSAQIVLVSDGEAPLDPAVIEEARRGTGDLPVGLSVVALGEENRALRDLVATQRAAGERAFYHFIPDATLDAIASGRGGSWLGALHAPGARDAPLPTAGAVRRELEDALVELSDLEEARHRSTLAAAEGARSLARRFERWFGEEASRDAPVAATSSAPLLRPSRDAEDVDAARVVLTTVAEVVRELGGRDEARLADAIDLAERLLPEARIAPTRYAEICSTWPQEIAAERAAVRRAARAWAARDAVDQARGPC